ITSLLTGAAYQMSVFIAANLGPFIRYEANAEHMRRVIWNHTALAWQSLGRKDVKHTLSYEPYLLDWRKYKLASQIGEAAANIWDLVLYWGENHGFRNAQVTVAAPTGTISFILDSSTTSA